MKTHAELKGYVIRKVVARVFVQKKGRPEGDGMMVNTLDCGHVVNLPASQSHYERKRCKECENALRSKPGRVKSRS